MADLGFILLPRFRASGMVHFSRRLAESMGDLGPVTVRQLQAPYFDLDEDLYFTALWTAANVDRWAERVSHQWVWTFDRADERVATWILLGVLFSWDSSFAFARSDAVMRIDHNQRLSITGTDRQIIAPLVDQALLHGRAASTQIMHTKESRPMSLEEAPFQKLQTTSLEEAYPRELWMFAIVLTRDLSPLGPIELTLEWAPWANTDEDSYLVSLWMSANQAARVDAPAGQKRWVFSEAGERVRSFIFMSRLFRWCVVIRARSQQLAIRLSDDHSISVASADAATIERWQGYFASITGLYASKPKA